MPPFVLAIRVTMLLDHTGLKMCGFIQALVDRKKGSSVLFFIILLLLLLFPGDSSREQLHQNLFPVQIVTVAACKVKQFQVGISQRGLLKQLQVNFIITVTEAIHLHLFYGSENGK